LEASEHVPEIIEEAFGDKKHNFWSWEHSPQVPDYQEFQIIRCRIKGILLYCIVKETANISK
jgi:hypothetical protein